MEATKQQYGTLPWRLADDGRLQILLVTSITRGRWIVPKGWPVEGRPAAESAATEAYEEAGVVGEVDSVPLDVYHYAKERKDGSFVRCRVDLFGLRVRELLTPWQEQRKRRRGWFSVTAAADTVDDCDLSRVIRGVTADPETLTGREVAFA